jgi:hypothetical protein
MDNFLYWSVIATIDGKQQEVDTCETSHEARAMAHAFQDEGYITGIQMKRGRVTSGQPRQTKVGGAI